MFQILVFKPNILLLLLLCSYFAECFMLPKDCKIYFYGNMDSPSYFLGEGAKKMYVNFKKNYRFIVYTYFCNLSLPMYSVVFILSNNLQKANQIIFFYEKNSVKIIKVKFHKIFIVQVNFKIIFQQDDIMLCE